MYCYHCGAKLVSEARFCHQCGKSLDIPEEKLDDKTIQAIKECILSGEEEIAPEVIEEMMKPVQRVEGPEIVLNILGHKLVLSNDIAGLKVVRDYFTDYAEKNVAKYKDYLSSNVRNFDDIYDKAIPFSVNCIKSAIENAVEVSKNLGIFDMSYEWLSTLMEGYMDCDALFSHYTQVANALENTAKQLASYRGLQRANVPQWYGGGFGIIGAIKGQMQATALNIGTNVIREIGNAVTDSRDKEKFKRAKEWLYKDAGLIDGLIMITYNCSFMPYYALLPIFEEVNMVSADAERDEEAVEKSHVIFENFYMGIKENAECVSSMLEIIENHPFNPAFYVYLEWIADDAIEDSKEAINILNLSYPYQYEKRALERLLFEDIKQVEDVSIESIRSKLKLLGIIEIAGVQTKDEIKAVRKELRKVWASCVQLLPEYDESEMQFKIEAFQELKREYGTETEAFKCYQDEINRLERKYENKVKLPFLEMDVQDVKNAKANVDTLIKEKRFGELWNLAEKQNGYAQTVLYRFYTAQIGNLKGKVNTVEQLDARCRHLKQKVEGKGQFAKFVYDVLVCKIKEVCNSGADREYQKRIHADYLYLLSEAVKIDIVYAKYCLVTEMVSKEEWENYECFRKKDTRLYDFSYNDVRIFIKETANALIPGAVDRLSDLYKGKGKTHLCGIEINYEKSDKLREFVRQLDIMEVLSIMERSYELHSLEASEAVEGKIVCSQCGNPIKEGKKFCSQCGAKII